MLMATCCTGSIIPNKSVLQDKLSGFVNKLQQRKLAAGSQQPTALGMTTIQQHHNTVSTAGSTKPMKTQQASVLPPGHTRAVVTAS
jgi:hypothetical protein